MPPISRRQFLHAAGTALLSGGLSSCTARGVDRRSGKQLNIFSWADYLPPDAISNFEKQYGIRVVYDTFPGNETLMARMEAGSVDYDIVVPTNYAVYKLKKLGLLHEIDKEQVPNLKNLSARFKQMAFDPGNQFSVPYTFGTTGIGFNQTALQQLGVPVPDDWDVFWEPRLKGRMTLLEDARESLGFALKRKGHSYNTVEPALVSAATRDLIEQKPLVMCYTSDQVIVYLTSGDARLSLAYSGDAHQARRNNSGIGYIIPASGASMWMDNMCIPKSAPHPQYAHLWINYILDPHVSASLTNYTYYPTPNEAARRYINAEMLADRTLYPSEAVLDKCEEIKDIGNGIFLYDRAWTELKCV